MTDTVLEFQQVTTEGGHLYDAALWQVSFRLQKSELMLVRLEAGHISLQLADVAQGLIEPMQGSVSFLGDRWSVLSDKARLAARARIGRVFEEPGWISELDMDDNITLLQRHHTRRPESAIRDEASELARLFSLPGLPQGRPSDMRAPDLRRAACVRAFLGQPELLILERPTAGVYPEIMPALMASVRAARLRGAAVLWTTDDSEVWNDAGIKPTIRGAMTGSQMSILAGH
jgi:phospholipid/cholesterol/gamma-HCH transport system ATP-binding protein